MAAGDHDGAFLWESDTATGKEVVAECVSSVLVNFLDTCGASWWEDLTEDCWQTSRRAEAYLASLAQEVQGSPFHCSKPETDAGTNCWQVYCSLLCCVSQWHKDWVLSHSQMSLITWSKPDLDSPPLPLAYVHNVLCNISSLEKHAATYTSGSQSFFQIFYK